MERRHGRRSASGLPGLDLAEERSWQNYLHAALRFDAAMNHRLTDEHQLPVIDLRVLDILAKSADGSVRMGELAEALESTRGRLTKRVQRLEERGLVRRETSPTDRRRVWAVITGDGRELVAEATATYADGVRDHLLRSLSRAQVITIEENCRRISAALKRSEGLGTDGS